MARTIHSPHSTGTRSANRSRSATLALERYKPDFVLRSVRPLAQEVAHYLRQVRPHLLARIFTPCGGRVREAQPRSQSRRAPLRPLHHRRDAVQIHGWMAIGFVHAHSIRKCMKKVLTTIEVKR